MQDGLALGREFLVPLLQRLGIQFGGFPAQGASKHVDIVNVAQLILDLLQVGGPCFVAFGQKIFNHVAKMLEPDAEPVPRDAASLPFGIFVELGSFV